MSNEFQCLIGLAALAGGKAPEVDTSAVDWERVFALAQEQGVQSLAAYGVKRLPSSSCPEEVRRQQLQCMRSAAIGNCIARGEVFSLMQRMEAAGIHTVLLKGYAVATAYAAPDCRISADTDLWIDPADEQKACRFLELEGFAVHPRWQNGHHAVGYHPQMGCVELHVQLYDEIVETIWFGRVDKRTFIQEPYVYVKKAEGAYRTLGYTDHLVFLTLHMMKHFISSGMSLSMMLDVALFFSKHKDEVDVGRFWYMIERLQYTTVVNCCLWAMIRYAGFETADFPGICEEEPELMALLLEDLEQGGRMGNMRGGEEAHVWDEYNRQLILREKGHWQYCLHMLRWNMKQVFPKRMHTIQAYPYVKKMPLLLPVAWLHRLIFRGVRSLLRGDLTEHIVMDADNLSELSKKRTAMFRALRMI